jgi:soluble lytic murein transglycosylase
VKRPSTTATRYKLRRMPATRTRSRSSAGRPPAGSGRVGRRLRQGWGWWLRRAFALGAAIAAGIAAGLLLSLPDKLEEGLLEFTLPLRHDDIIRQQAAEKDVDAALIAAVIYAESRFQDQTSHAGARGLMQITPATARDIERLSGGETFVLDDLSDPDINIRYGTYWLRHLLGVYGGNEVAALAAYNAGRTNADRWGGAALSLEDIPTAETRGYVDQVLDKRGDYRDKYAEELGYR